MRNRIFWIIFVPIVFASSYARADEKPRPVSDESTVLLKPAPVAPPARTTLFVVETDEQSAVESLNRVAGEIDKGFVYSDDDSSYKSDNQTRPSPFARQEQQDRR
jgi:hypothetical protein